MKLFICPNSLTAEAKKIALSCIEKLQVSNLCSVSKENSLLLYEDESHHTFSAQEADYVISIGGDGAVLRASRIAISANKPLLGIKAGRLGFLTALHCEEVDKITEDYLNNMERQYYSLLTYETETENGIAVNDVVLGKTYFGETVELETTIDGNLLGHWRCDGIIIATPLGSTSYNLSAGGPVVLPDAKAVVITPICPHGFGPLTYIASENSEVIVKVIRESKAEPSLFVDGEDKGHINTLKVRISKQKLLLLKNGFVSETLSSLK